VTTTARASRLADLEHPLSITMWDFSWLERRWPGAGFEDPAATLDELTDRGYDAVRIDPYPHLVAADARREWELLPHWNQQTWGAPARTRVMLEPALTEFIALCAERDVRVALSSWFRQDTTDRRLSILTPDDLAQVWIATLSMVDQAGLLDHILYVDLVNEWPLRNFTRFLPPPPPPAPPDSERLRTSPEVTRWTNEALAAVRRSYPGLALCFSHAIGPEGYDPAEDLSGYDLLEPHVWMAGVTDFYERVGYSFSAFDPGDYERLVDRGERLYRERPEYWLRGLDRGIDGVAQRSLETGLPLVTTECWGVIDYKDWPLLSWDWAKELCSHGTHRASATGRWSAMATSNFCQPQFVGMWRDRHWHRELTEVIRSGSLPPPRSGHNTGSDRTVGAKSAPAAANSRFRGDSLAAEEGRDDR
jgi:hypothetical protein